MWMDGSLREEGDEKVNGKGLLLQSQGYVNVPGVADFHPKAE